MLSGVIQTNFGKIVKMSNSNLNKKKKLKWKAANIEFEQWTGTSNERKYTNVTALVIKCNYFSRNLLERHEISNKALV